MKRFKVLVATFAVALFGGLALVPVTPAAALDPLADVCSTGSNSSNSEICKNKDEDGSSLIKTVVNTLLFIIGSLSVVMIIVAGVFYVISSGDAGKVARAKNTLTYAIVGLVVSFLAFAIVNWVAGLF